MKLVPRFVPWLFALYFSLNIPLGMTGRTKVSSAQKMHLEPDSTPLKKTMENQDSILLIATSYGTIRVKLYADTPLHRENMLKLVRDGFYDGTLFHRVIRDFMIQGGDPDSKNAAPGDTLGRGDAGYTVPAEFMPDRYFHKRGALAAARKGDEVNPERASSGCQFYVVTGKIYTKAQLSQIETQINKGKSHAIFEQLVAKNADKIKKLRMDRNRNGWYALQEELLAEAEALALEQADFKFTPAQIEVYTREGGAPFLDGQYTVFGEILEGMEVIEKIEKAKTGRNDRPKEDISMRISILE